jgi:hypothetical protein
MRLARLCIAGLATCAAPLLMAPLDDGCHKCRVLGGEDTVLRRRVASESLWQELVFEASGRHYVEVDVQRGQAEVELVVLPTGSPAYDVRCDGDALYTYCELDAEPGSHVGLSIAPLTAVADLTIRAGAVGSED